MFENLSLPHLLMVVGVALLVFGPRRIPEIGGAMGKGIREFRRSLTGTANDESSGLPDTHTSRPGSSAGRDLPGDTETTIPAGDREPKRLLK